ncbi:tumor necrosis factor receptor superfamily member 11B-like isoform X1 [Hypomesus transpacificus]|uniref:tumor necrosis factor receptor superfamily member 11B-like isoform X1 n=1 Tax=Hypomesus transpacificus TaxID=137520 RepID=UPI001F07510A|nr:tumor necrosis factor receptor superfamily member 11B-like isoform X1 [Hypomesus transpacificus]
MNVRIMKSHPAMKLFVLFTASLSWAFQPAPRPKYSHLDPLTSELLQCDQCPPGTAVWHHCTADEPTICMPCPERRFSDDWHWGESCQRCTSVCKERQLVKRECNSTHDQLCECGPGFHLVVEFCIKHSTCAPGNGAVSLGTPQSDTVCEPCPQGYFSSVASPIEPCVPHTNCSELGMRSLRAGSTSQDSQCDNQAKSTDLECSRQHTLCQTDVTLCEEAIFQSLASLRLSSVPLERLLDSLPGRKVDRKSLEKLKKACSPQQLLLQLLLLWKEQNKDQDKLYGIIQGVKHCERRVSRCTELKNLTLNDLMVISNSLPGVKVCKEDVRAVVTSCSSQQYILQLLHLWKRQNAGVELAKGLSHCLRTLRGQGSPRHLLKSIKRISRIISSSSIHKMYEKMFLSMVQDSSCFKTKPFNE